MFGFDSPPVFRAAHHREAARLLPVLVRHGADPNVRTSWWAGGFGALDHAQGETVDLLLRLGAKWDVWSAATHGQVDILRELLDKDPASVNAPGGDGERPIHFAKNAEIAELLIERGADLEQKDVDHEGTPIQYQVNNKEVVHLLLRHGAKPDVFTAAVLNDVEMLRKIVAEDPEAPLARVGKPPFVTVDSEGGHIYSYRLGSGKTPQQVAAQFGSKEVLDEFEKHSPPARLLVAAAWAGDAATVARLKGAEIPAEEMSTIAWAAHDGRAETVRLLLEAGSTRRQPAWTPAPPSTSPAGSATSTSSDSSSAASPWTCATRTTAARPSAGPVTARNTAATTRATTSASLKPSSPSEPTRRPAPIGAGRRCWIKRGIGRT